MSAVGNDIYSMLNDLKVQSERELNHLESLRNDLEHSIRTHFDSIRQMLPPTLLQTTVGELSSNGGSIVWVPENLQLVVKMPKHKNQVMSSTFVDTAVKPNFSSFSVIANDSLAPPEARPKCVKKSFGISNKKKVIVGSSKRTRQFGNILNTTEGLGATRRASLQRTKTKAAKDSSRIKENATCMPSLKVNAKPARKAVPGEEIYTIYCSKTGTPLIISDM